MKFTDLNHRLPPYSNISFLTDKVMKNSVKPLTFRYLPQDQLELLMKQLTLYDYNDTSELYQEGQVPRIGLIIVKGSIEVHQKNKLVTKLGPGTLIGVNELYRDIEADHSAIASANTQAIAIFKSNLIDAENQKDHPLSSLIDHINQT